MSHSGGNGINKIPNLYHAGGLMNIHVYSDENYWVDLVPVLTTINQWRTRFGMDETVIGEVGGVLSEEQAEDVLDLIDWGRDLGKASVQSRLATIFRRRYSELEDMGIEEAFSRGLALLETEND